MYERMTVVTRKGQITIPVEIRRVLGLQVGDRVALSLSEDGEPIAQLRPVQSVAERTFGAIKARKRPEDFKELRRLFMEGQAAEAMKNDSGDDSAI